MFPLMVEQFPFMLPQVTSPLGLIAFLGEPLNAVDIIIDMLHTNLFLVYFCL